MGESMELPRGAVRIAKAVVMMALSEQEVRRLIKDGTLRTCGSGNGIRVVIDSMLPWLPVRSEPEPEPLGCIYLVRSGEHYKIGLTKDIKRRMRSFTLSLPHPAELIHTIPIEQSRMKWLEGILHEQFKAQRCNGEWFMLSDEQVQAICEYVQ